MPVIRFAAALAALLLLVLPQTGCLAVAAAAGAGAGVAYAGGDREEVLQGSPPEVAAAAEAAFLELGMPVTFRTAKATESEVVARTARDKKVEVVSALRGDGTTRVSVRAGVWGDDALQDRVIDKIREHLAASRVAPADGGEAAN
jgi:hypothetical protein